MFLDLLNTTTEVDSEVELLLSFPPSMNHSEN